MTGDAATTPLAVVACLDALAGEHCACEGVIAHRHNSRIHRARCQSGQVAVKECFESRTLTPDPLAAEREFAALTTVSKTALAAGERSLFPVPLALCREHAAYAMTWVTGRPATDLVVAHSTRFDDAVALGESTGNWLSRFHALRPLPPRRGDYESKLRFVDEILAEGGSRDPLLRRASNSLAKLAAEASAVQVPASWIHGDMKSDNLLIDGTRVTGLDVHLIAENTVAYDLAPFLIHLRLLRWSPRGLLRTRNLSGLAEGFLRAYSPAIGEWRLPLAWLRAYLLLQMLASSRRLSSMRTLTTGWPLRHELAASILQLDQIGRRAT